MNQDVYRILYCSRNHIGGPPSQQNTEIGKILKTARTKNSQHNVTGALLFNSGYFAQVLEGSRPAIERIFETIQRDSRHGDVIVLESGLVQERDFSDWSMAYVRPPSEEEAVGVAAVLGEAVSNPAASAGTVMQLLRTLVIQEE